MKNIAPPVTVAQALAQLQGLGLARLDAQMLVLHALGRPVADRAWLLTHDIDAMPVQATEALRIAMQRRLDGEPLAYITGHKEFFGLNLHVDTRVLVPRPDTETLVEWALELLASAPIAAAAAAAAASATQATPPSATRLVDLGTGSGAIALALKHTRPDLQVTAVDFSADALAVAQANAQRLKLAVQFAQGSWLEPVQGRFELIVSNPPYIASDDHHLAALKHEPLQALASGADGLDDIRTIIRQAGAHLQPGGWLLLEHGYDQAAAVRALLADAGLQHAQSRCDLAGIARCSGAQQPDL